MFSISFNALNVIVPFLTVPLYLLILIWKVHFLQYKVHFSLGEVKSMNVFCSVGTMPLTLSKIEETSKNVEFCGMLMFLKIIFFSLYHGYIFMPGINFLIFLIYFALFLLRISLFLLVHMTKID